MNYEKFAKILSGKLDSSVKIDQKEFIKNCIKEFFLEKMTIEELWWHLEKSIEIAWLDLDKDKKEMLIDKVMELICTVKVWYDRAKIKLINEYIIGHQLSEVLDRIFN